MTTNLESPCSGCGKTPQTCSCNTGNTKHPPGPWRVHRLGSHTHIDAVGNHPLADVYGGMSEPTICDANARLIAAAPQLLDALEAALKSLNEVHGKLYLHEEIPRYYIDVLKPQIQAAIRSAKRETL